jgi:predicted esterase
MMRNDTDLEAVRQHAEFKHLLEQVSRRFAIEAPKRGQSPSIHVPEGVAPSNGWPILLFLHGYGDNGESYGPLADAATQCGFAGITISGPVVLWDQEYSWPTENFAATHSYLRRVLTHYSESKDLDRSRIYLCGFSQGATHAVGLVASYPREYAGAIALSPGGRPQLPQDVQTANPARPLYVTVGQMEHPANKELAKQSAELWRRASWPLLQHLHPGNHEFPDDWSDRFPRVLTWISNPTNGQ